MSAPRYAPTLGEQLAWAAEAQGVGVSFLDRREQETFFSYTELHRRARQVAGALLARGLGGGARVGLVLPTGPAFYDAFFGCQLAGLVPVPLYPPVRLGRMDEYYQRTANMLTSVQASLVLTDRRVRRLLGPVVESAAPSHGCLALEDLALEDLALEDLAPAPHPDHLAFIQLSSGTTVEPKPICLTHRQVQANVAAILDTILRAFPEEATDGDSADLRHAGVSWLPLYHDMGLVGCVLTALARPGDLTLIPPELFVARPAVWLRTISRHQATISPAPNFAYSLCVDRVRDKDLQGVDLSSWRVALNGAESVTPAVLESFVRRFGGWGLRPEALTPVYGLAEATLAVTFSPLDRPFRWRHFDSEALASRGRAAEVQDNNDGSPGVPLVSLGCPLPGFKVRVVDGAGTPLSPGRLGRVQVSGPSIMAGYFGRPRQTSKTLQGGWLDTGDSGFLLDGELYLHGRDKDLIILAGRNHAPQELEQCLDGLSGVRTGCVAAVGILPPGEPGERLVMLVERARAAPHRVDDKTLEEQIRSRLAEGAGQRPWRVEVLAPGTLPRTSSGKIRRGEARRRYLCNQLTPPERVGWFSLASHLVRSRISLARAQKLAQNSRFEADHSPR